MNSAAASTLTKRGLDALDGGSSRPSKQQVKSGRWETSSVLAFSQPPQDNGTGFINAHCYTYQLLTDRMTALNDPAAALQSKEYKIREIISTVST